MLLLSEETPKSLIQNLAGVVLAFFGWRRKCNPNPLRRVAKVGSTNRCTHHSTAGGAAESGPPPEYLRPVEPEIGAGAGEGLPCVHSCRSGAVLGRERNRAGLLGGFMESFHIPLSGAAEVVEQRQRTHCHLHLVGKAPCCQLAPHLDSGAVGEHYGSHKKMSTMNVLQMLQRQAGQPIPQANAPFQTVSGAPTIGAQNQGAPNTGETALGAGAGLAAKLTRQKR